jgi:thiamine-phosphate pyrophosphorylase
VVHLRAKRATDREQLAWAAEIRALTTAAGALFILNDRFDLALAAGADGVHLGQDDLPPARVCPGARERLLLGRSTHSLEQAYAAGREPVDYLAFGQSSARPPPPRGARAGSRSSRRWCRARAARDRDQRDRRGASRGRACGRAAGLR